MTFQFLGGPARTAGPRFFSGAFRSAALAVLAALAALAAPSATAADWIPPRPISAWFPSATIAPGGSASLELVLRADGAPASVEWSAVSSGAFLSTVTPSSGALVLQAGTLTRVPLSVGVPAASIGLGSVSITVRYANGGTIAAKTTATIVAATDGRPEIWPNAPTWSGAAGASGAAAFTVRGLSGSSETVVVTAGKSNSDPNNIGVHFPPGGSAPATLFIPTGGTVPLQVTGALAGNAWAGNSNMFQVNLTCVGGISTATAFAIVQTANPDSLPTALRPVGVTPLGHGAAGRDGPVPLLSRNAWLVPEGFGGVEVCRATGADSIGLTDGDGDGGDDRLIGTIRIPAFAAALAVVPGFVATGGETFDLGLLAAGRSGLMLLDLRVIEDPAFGAWEDFFDTDQNGVDDRILRTIPLPGFATDVAWTLAPSGRVVAFVADADTGSVPVAAGFDPLSTTPGTGSGIVAIDVTAAVDSLSGLPVVAGTWSTPGNALDAEVRGSGSAVTLAVADGAAGLAVADVALGAGVPATAAFSPRAAVSLSAAWGAPYARDVSWLAHSNESAYVAVACAEGGLQFARIPEAGTPVLVLAQETPGLTCGIATALTGMVAAAKTSGGVALFQAPGRAAFDLVTPGAPAPYTAPVTLANGASFPGGAPLERARFQNPAGGATALTFEPTTGPLPDLFVSDSSRLTVLRPGALIVTAVGEDPREAPGVKRSVRLDVLPNPVSGGAIVRARAGSGGAGSAGRGGAASGALRATDRIDILDVQGRVVRTLRAPAVGGAGDFEYRLTWDGRDRAGRRVPSGRYWARLRTDGRTAGGATSFLVLQ